MTRNTVAERFYCPQLDQDDIELDPGEAHHLRVSRWEVGDRVVLFDGRGLEVSARIVELGRRRARLVVEERRRVDRELPGRLVLCVPAPQGERQRWLMEKATELGVHELRLIVTCRSDAHSRGVRTERFQRWAVEACKQCGRNVLPLVHAPVPWTEAVRALEAVPTRLLCHPTGDPIQPAAPGEVVAVAVGPEGGWTEEEVEAAEGGGWRVVSLGPTILRTETAAIAALAVLRSGMIGHAKS